MIISQSMIKYVLPLDVCPQAIKFKFVDKMEVEPSDVMQRGKYFEWHLTGATRDGIEPQLEKLKRGGKSKAELDLEELVLYAKSVCDEVGLDLKSGDAQVELVHKDLIGHIDLITKDLHDPSREAIYDVKYTETQYDDRWNGWGDFSTMLDQQIQAAQYIMLYYWNYNRFVPYYFVVFGKSFWCRIIKVEITEQGLITHNNRIEATRAKLASLEADGYKPLPEFIKCQKCAFNHVCKHVETKPTIEVFQI